MRFWLEFFRDKRFGWGFKIANFIMRDSLRNYLAFVSMTLNSIIESDDCTVAQKRRIISVINDINRLKGTKG